MSTIIRPVRDILPDDRHVVERVVGQQLQEQDQLIIQLMPKLPAWCDVYAGLSDAEIDAIESLIMRTHTSREVS